MAQYLFFDTETDGLNIITNRPFSYQLSIGLKGVDTYYDVSKKTTKMMDDLLKVPDTWLIGHNIKFDIHMLINEGIPIERFRNVRIIDTMFMARLAIDHTEQVLSKYRAPLSLALSKLGERFLGVNSRDEELIIKEKFKEMNAHHKIAFKVWLTSYLKKVPTTEQLNHLYNMTEADELVTSVDKQTLQDVAQYKLNNPWPTYKDIPEYMMKPYGVKDIILTKGLFSVFLSIIKSKQQQKVMVRESQAMYALLLMEREGLAVDKDEAKRLYQTLYNYRKKHAVVKAPVNLIRDGAQPVLTYFEQTTKPSIKSNTLVYDSNLDIYLEYQKKDVIAIEGQPMNLKSSQQMAALYRYETGDDTIVKADKAQRELIKDISPTAAMIQRLRPLDKLLDTYLYRLINQPILDADGNWKIYSMYNNLSNAYDADDDTAGTVTGRLSSDLQQFPKEPLLDENGNELVNIRKLFIVPKGKHSMWYFDLAQLELRLQTIWSAIIDGVPDKVMARGFVPYNCTELFNDDGTSKGWFLNEDLTVAWQPTDFHTIAAQSAFGALPDYEQEKKHYRSLGKRSNFAISYGASKWKVMESLKVSEAQAEDLIKGFKTAYVGLTHMEKYLKHVTRVQEYQTNLFGRRYYTRDVHKLKNWLVQGSGGDLLKIFLARLVPFVERYPHWRFMLTVHDEIDFVLDKAPTHQEIQEVLDLMFYSAGGIDVTSDAEYTLTSWGEQIEYKIP